jgi:hypothetical protein
MINIKLFSSNEAINAATWNVCVILDLVIFNFKYLNQLNNPNRYWDCVLYIGF